MSVIVLFLSLGSVEEKFGKKVCDEEIAALQDAEILLVDNNTLAQCAQCPFLRVNDKGAISGEISYSPQVHSAEPPSGVSVYERRPWCDKKGATGQRKPSVFDRKVSREAYLAVGDLFGVEGAAASCECKESVALPLSPPTPPSSRESPLRCAGPSARQECGDLRHRPQELDAPVPWKACRAQFAALASGVKGVKGLAGGLPLRRVRIKGPLRRGKKPAHFASAWNHRKKSRRRNEHGRPHRKHWRPRGEPRMKRTHSYLPPPRLQEDGEQLSHTSSVWPPPKLVQVAITACYDGGGMQSALYQAEPATASCC
ncbi:hypothetical protein GWK47_038716 [Chionoecetes opilio]|uniref:Uncharacterized protein n=1 Tax=Chionoecetes opilio TaxID=41210 RepID=A0A8J4YCA2_CHIOP|nr:hypothetical protein GWK47_038716 [Chionoecetes opilio]